MEEEGEVFGGFPLCWSECATGLGVEQPAAYDQPSGVWLFVSSV